MKIGFKLAVCGVMLWSTAGLYAATITLDQERFIGTASAQLLAVIMEDFSTPVWDVTRGPFLSAVSVTSKGVEWTCNHPGCAVQTYQGSVRAGEWAVFSDPQGDPGATDPLDPTYSGFIGTRAPGVTGFRGVGGYFTGNGGNLNMLLDGVRVAELRLDNVAQWLEVWSPTPFRTFEVREVDGEVQQLRTVFGDGFALAIEPPCGIPATCPWSRDFGGGPVAGFEPQGGTNPGAVPEAASSLLLLTGLAALGGLSRVLRRE
jgi:hypothetical protein